MKLNTTDNGYNLNNSCEIIEMYVTVYLVLLRVNQLRSKNIIYLNCIYLKLYKIAQNIN